MFDFLRKKGEVPDVGKEEQFEEEKNGKKAKKLEKKSGKNEVTEAEEVTEEKEEAEEEAPEPEAEKGWEKEERKGRARAAEKNTSNFESEKINARLEAVNETIKGYSERFSRLSEQIGEVRAMALGSEKDILNLTGQAAKAVDIVREVKPEQLRVDYQRADAKIQALNEKIEANKDFMDTIMNEIKDLRTKAGIFIGTDALLKLNEEVKKDLIEIQRVSSRVRVNSEKSEEIFVELRRGFAETQKVNEVVSNLDASYSGLKKEIEKYKVDYSAIVKQDELESFQKAVSNKIAIIESSAAEVESIKEEIGRVSQLVETVAAISRKNKEDIADIAMSIGDDHIQRVSDYETQLASILKIIDTLAGQINEIKRKMNVNTPKMFVKPLARIPFKKKLEMEHVELHPKISQNLVKKPEVPEAIQRIQDDKDGKESRNIDKKVDSLIKDGEEK